MKPTIPATLYPLSSIRHPLPSILYLLWGAFLIWQALCLAPDTWSTLRFATLGAVQFPTRLGFLLCGVMACSAGAVCVLVRPRSRWHTCSLWLNALGIVMVALVWASMGRRLEVLGIVTQSIRLATPIALGALAGILSERCGVVNIAIEGMMLSAACAGFTVALYTQESWVGVLAAVLTGGAMAALHAVLALHARVDQIISGTVINMLAVGLTGFIRRTFLLHTAPAAPTLLPVWPLPFLSEIPVLGRLFFHQQPIVYSMFVLVAVVHLVLFTTRWGLRTRAVGEHPQAADTLGVSVITIRYGNIVAGGMIAGLGGAWFSLETVGSFEDLMTSGKGFIALAAMIFGNWNPLGALAGALLFGLSDALQIKLQIVGVEVPYQFLGMLPYLVTMIVLAGVVGRARPPAASGRPYRRDTAAL